MPATRKPRALFGLADNASRRPAALAYSPAPAPKRGHGAALGCRVIEQHESHGDESDRALGLLTGASRAIGSFEQRQVGNWNQDAERSCLTGRALQMAIRLQRENHLMNRGRRNLEVPLDVRFCGCAAIDLFVVVDESQVLALACGEFFRAHSRELGI